MSLSPNLFAGSPEHCSLLSTPYVTPAESRILVKFSTDLTKFGSIACFAKHPNHKTSSLSGVYSGILCNNSLDEAPSVLPVSCKFLSNF